MSKHVQQTKTSLTELLRIEKVETKEHNYNAQQDLSS